MLLALPFGAGQAEGCGRCRDEKLRVPDALPVSGTEGEQTLRDV